MRLLVLHNIVNPHTTPVFEALSCAPGVDLTVAFFAELERDRTWNAGRAATFRSVVLPGRELSLPLRWDKLSLHVNFGFGRFMREAKPDVVLNAGWMSLSNWHAFAACRLRRIPHVLWAGSTHNESSWRRTLTLPAVKLMVRGSDAWVTYGTASAEYLADLGADRARIVPGYHCIDNERFLALCERARPEVSALRQSLALGDRKVVLFVGRMVGCKGCEYLIDAMARLANERQDIALVMAGDGPMRTEWERRAGAMLPPGMARFVGSQSLEALPLYYELSDVFVLPSVEEVWGLVVNEAALAGRPLVVSEGCGAAIDLVEPGVNGHRVRPGDVEALFLALRDVLGDADRALQMGRASRRIVERCTPEKVAAALLRGAEIAARVSAAGGAG